MLVGECVTLFTPPIYFARCSFVVAEGADMLGSANMATVVVMVCTTMHFVVSIVLLSSGTIIGVPRFESRCSELPI